MNSDCSLNILYINEDYHVGHHCKLLNNTYVLMYIILHFLLSEGRGGKKQERLNAVNLLKIDGRGKKSNDLTKIS